MGLLAIIAGEEAPPEGTRGLSPHGIASVLGEFLRGRYTSGQIASRMGLAPGTLLDEITAWAAPFNGIAPESTIHGALYVVNSSADQPVNAGGFTKVTQFTSVGDSDGCAPSAVDDEIVVTRPGVYRVSYACTFTGPNLAQIGLRVSYSGSGQNQTLATTPVLATNVPVFLSGEGFVHVASKAATAFQLQVQSTQAGNFGLISGQFLIERIQPEAARLDPGGNPVDRQKIHDVLNGLEQGLYTIAEAAAELDYTTLP